MGYYRAGFEVIGVDNRAQPNYPFRFIQADWQEALDMLMDFDVIHASPPCQAYSAMSHCRPGLAATYPDLIAEVRYKLESYGLPYVIENVPGAPLREPTLLCGQMFGRALYRHRLFETNFPVVAPVHQDHVLPASRAGHWKPGTIMSVAGHFSPVAHARYIMGIEWMTRDEMGEAIPPAYTEYIGYLLTDQLRRRGIGTGARYQHP